MYNYSIKETNEKGSILLWLLLHDIGQVPGGKNVVNEPLSMTVRNIVTISDRNNVLKGS